MLPVDYIQGDMNSVHVSKTRGLLTNRTDHTCNIDYHEDDDDDHYDHDVYDVDQ